MEMIEWIPNDINEMELNTCSHETKFIAFEVLHISYDSTLYMGCSVFVCIGRHRCLDLDLLTFEIPLHNQFAMRFRVYFEIKYFHLDFSNFGQSHAKPWHSEMGEARLG